MAGGCKAGGCGVATAATPQRARTSVLAATVFGVAIALQSCGRTPVLSSVTATREAPPTTTRTVRNTDTPSPTARWTITPSPSARPSPSAMAERMSVAACVPTTTRTEAGQVARVIDGDTIEVRIGSETYRVRYIGMDTPEVGDPFGAEATARNRELVEDQTVTMVKDVSETDRYGRLLRYVFVGDTFVNYELVVEGYALASTYPPDVACAGTFVEAQRMALAAGSGLWAAAGVSGGQESATPPPAGNCDPSYPTVCIPPPPPDLDCSQIPNRRFQVLPPDPLRFDGDHDGVGCEGG